MEHFSPKSPHTNTHTYICVRIRTHAHTTGSIPNTLQTWTSGGEHFSPKSSHTNTNTRAHTQVQSQVHRKRGRLVGNTSLSRCHILKHTHTYICVHIHVHKHTHTHTHTDSIPGTSQTWTSGGERFSPKSSPTCTRTADPSSWFKSKTNSGATATST